MYKEEKKKVGCSTTSTQATQQEKKKKKKKRKTFPFIIITREQELTKKHIETYRNIYQYIL